jgi:nucleoside-diphosphate-sugar epimerase
LSFRAAHARIFRSYGRGSRDVVSRWVRAALAGEEIEVYHPENQFDYVFAGDVAEGLLRMVRSPAAEGAINLASGTARPVSAVIEAIEAATGTRLSAGSRDANEPFEASQAGLSRLRRATEWSPQTDLQSGVRLIVDFERRLSANVVEPGSAETESFPPATS